MTQSSISRIVLFDGECILCNKAAQFIINRDPNELFKFASLQSNYGKQLLNKMGNNSVDYNSIILIEGEKHFIKSAAVLKILRELRGYSFLYHILKLFPRILLDSLYNFTAKIRYQIFGQTKHCAIYQKSEFSNRVANAPENS
jgi:predicted DCC family thiol-disulfide oxidoreductase YuxK